MDIQETPVGWDFSNAVEIGDVLTVWHWRALTWHSFPFQGIEGLLHFSYKVSEDDICL